MFKKTQLLSGLSMLLLWLAGCTGTPTTDEEKEVTAIPDVTVGNPVTRSFSNAVIFTGTTQYQQKAVIRAGIAGYVHHRGWKTGDVVKAGGTFCTITSKEQEALKGLDQHDILAKFRAPIPVIAGTGGVLTAVNYQNGDFVSEGDILATLTKQSSLVLLVNVPVEYLNKIKAGTACTVLMPDGSKVNTYLQAGLPTADPVVQTQSFIIPMPGSNLPEGANLKVSVTLSGAEQALAVPVSAVQTDETQKEFWIFKVGKDSVAYKINVEAGKISADSMQEIKTSKLGLNDNVIITGGYGLADSSKVKIKK